MQCCPRASRKLCTGKKSFSVLTYYSWDSISQVKTLPNINLEAQDNNAQEQIQFNLVLILLGQHCAGKSLCTVVQQGAPEEIAQEKIIFNVVLILLKQHCTGKNLRNLRGSRQHCTWKNSFQCRLNNITLWQFLFWSINFFNNDWLLQIPCEHSTNFPYNAQELPQANIEQKDKIVQTTQRLCSTLLDEFWQKIAWNI